jgi:uncharacterized protein YbjT (DUF2867 family)
MSNHIAIVLGASGSVGQALLAELTRSARFTRVIALTRRPLPSAGAGVLQEWLVPDMAPVHLWQAVLDALAGCDGQVLGFSVLGVGAGTAKMTLEEHRAVDVALNAAFASGLRASGKVGHLAFMSAIGADATASTSGSGAAGMPRYARVKGEAEQAVLDQGPAVVSIFRPSVIIGSQHTPRLLAIGMQAVSALLPRDYRPIHSAAIARAMVAVALSAPASSGIYSGPQMQSASAGLV